MLYDAGHGPLPVGPKIMKMEEDYHEYLVGSAEQDRARSAQTQGRRGTSRCHAREGYKSSPNETFVLAGPEYDDGRRDSRGLSGAMGELYA